MGLALVLVLNFLLVRRTLVPLQRLTQTMRGLLRERLERSAEEGAADVLTAREQDGGPPFTGGRREPPMLRMARLADEAACA